MTANYIYGIRPLIEAIKSGKEIEKLFVRKGIKGELVQELLSISRKLNIPINYVPVEKLNRITRKNHQGVVAYISLVSYSNIEEIVPMLYEEGKNPLILVLDQITDIRNIGAIARSAECGGVNAIVIPFKGGAIINSDAIKSSAGALYKIPVCREKNLVKTIEFLKNSGLQIVVASEQNDSPYYNIDFNQPTTIVMGSEDKGVSIEIQKISSVFAKIPIIGEIESLNVANACSVLIYEAVRQRLSE